MPAAKLTLAELAEVARLHNEAGMPVSELARLHWQRWGYSSEPVAQTALCRRLHHHGYLVARSGRPASGRTKTSRRTDRRRDSCKITYAQVLAAHRLYVAGMSMRELAERIWQRFGYASARSCETCLREQFHREGLPVRTRSQAQCLIPEHGAEGIVQAYRDGQSTYQIAETHWRRWGYANAHTARRGIATILRRAGLPTPSRAQASMARERRKRGLPAPIVLTCVNGHPWTPENTMFVSGAQRCRTCHRRAQRKWREKVAA